MSIGFCCLFLLGTWYLTVYSARSSLAAPFEWAHDAAVFVFSAGFALEVLADYQLNKHKKKTGNATLNREGVWSIVRHPKYVPPAISSTPTLY